MAKIGLPKGSGKRLKVREKSVKSQGILKWILSGNPGLNNKSALYLERTTARLPGSLNILTGQIFTLDSAAVINPLYSGNP